MEHYQTPALFITEKKYIDYSIPGGVQRCTEEFVHYFEKAGYALTIFKVQPVVTVLKRIKIKLGLETYDLYEADQYLEEITAAVISGNIKIVLFNQLNLAHWTDALKKRLPDDVRFIGLSHGNESGDYLHEATNTGRTTFLQTWRLGKLLVKEHHLFRHLLNGVITISEHDSYINQWLGAGNVLYLPRILQPDLISWIPVPDTIGFVGTLNHLPNLQGITDMAEALTARNFSGQLRLAGGPPETGYDLAKKYPFIHYSGALTETELRKEVASWSVFLNPVFWYSRGSSTKLAQGLAWGLPVVSTPAGTRGYDLSDPDLCCADNTPASFVTKVLSTLASPSLLSALKQTAENNTKTFNLEPWLLQLRLFVAKITGTDA